MKDTPPRPDFIVRNGWFLWGKAKERQLKNEQSTSVPTRVTAHDGTENEGISDDDFMWMLHRNEKGDL